MARRRNEPMTETSEAIGEPISDAGSATALAATPIRRGFGKAQPMAQIKRGPPIRPNLLIRDRQVVGSNPTIGSTRRRPGRRNQHALLNAEERVLSLCA